MTTLTFLWILAGIFYFTGLALMFIGAMRMTKRAKRAKTKKEK